MKNSFRGNWRAPHWEQNDSVVDTFTPVTGEKVWKCGFFATLSCGLRARRPVSHLNALMEMEWNLFHPVHGLSQPSTSRETMVMMSEGSDNKKWVTQIVGHRPCKQGSTTEGPSPSCSLLLSVSAVPSCSVRLDSVGQFTLNSLKAKKQKENTEHNKKISRLFSSTHPVCREVHSHIVALQGAAVCCLPVVSQQRPCHHLRKRLWSPGELQACEKAAKRMKWRGERKKINL